MPTKANTGSFRRRGGPTRSIAAPDPDQITVPPLPKTRDWTPEAARWWDTVSRSAMASEWEADDLAVVERGLRLVDDAATLDGIGNLSEEKKLRLRIQVSAEMRLLESTLGLSPAARSRLRVEIVRGEEAERRRARGVRAAGGTEGGDELAERREDLRRAIEGA